MTDREMLEAILSKMNDGFEKIDEKFEKIDERFEKIDERFEKLETELKLTKDEVSVLRAELKQDVRNVELHLENITDKNIQTIAESHIDLINKCDKALKSDKERELLELRVKVIEEELVNIKEKLNKRCKVL